MGIQTPTSPAVEKTDEIKKQVVEVTEILNSNVEMMKNRGENFDSMQAKSNDLEMGSDMFRRNSAGAERRQWWHMIKFKIFLVLTVIFLLGCGITGIFFWNWRNKLPKEFPDDDYYAPLGPEDHARYDDRPIQ